MRTKLLFVCSRNLWRSPTAESLFRNHPRYEARSAGTENSARIKLTAGHVGWADLIFCMEKKHAARVQERFQPELAGKPLETAPELGIGHVVNVRVDRATKVERLDPVGLYVDQVQRFDAVRVEPAGNGGADAGAGAGDESGAPAEIEFRFGHARPLGRSGGVVDPEIAVVLREKEGGLIAMIVAAFLFMGATILLIVSRRAARAAELLPSDPPGAPRGPALLEPLAPQVITHASPVVLPPSQPYTRPSGDDPLPRA